jgi:hypothetical protein
MELRHLRYFVAVAEAGSLTVAAQGGPGGRHASYEKLAIHYLALVQISMIRLLVRRLERPFHTQPNTRSTRNSAIQCFLVYFQVEPALPFPMVAPVPAQISQLRSRPSAAARARSLPLLTTPLTTYSVICITWLPFSETSAYFPSPRGCTVYYTSIIPDDRLSDLPAC